MDDSTTSTVTDDLALVPMPRVRSDMGQHPDRARSGVVFLWDPGDPRSVRPTRGDAVTTPVQQIIAESLSEYRLCNCYALPDTAVGESCDHCHEEAERIVSALHRAGYIVSQPYPT